MPRPTPLLVLGDSPDAYGGLSRIGRDLATLLTRSPRFRVGFLGRDMVGSRKLPFVQYAINTAAGQWGEGTLQRVWQDFAGDEEGILFTIWDASRLLWLAQPQLIAEKAPELAAWLATPPFHKWGYFPIDSTGPMGRLTSMSQATLMGYQRLLAYTAWGEGIIRATIGNDAANARGIGWMPHGLNGDTFQPRDRKATRQSLRWKERELVVGVVATNQQRKDWGLAAATIATLRQQVPYLRLWAHIDDSERHWSMAALLTDYGIGDITTMTYRMNDTELSHWLSACDVTMHIGGEGYGYPIFESLLCGTPVVHGDYAGGADILRQCGHATSLIPPVAYRIDTTSNCVRAVYDYNAWAERILAIVQQPPDREALRASVEHLLWPALWPRFQRWFEEGLATL